MPPSIRLIARRISLRGMIPALVSIIFILFPLLALADEDPCGEMGIYIGNQTMINLWYTRNNGSCTLWDDNHILIVKPEDTLIIYRDMICKTDYCSQNPTYDVYKSFDANRNCRMKILPDCTLADM